ncbi:MAG: transcriptional regulator [Alphaproteobacteria bacterium RIFOXYD12_FULL_60_8]|nr:MAG: transcriptional regulator [Alphaproteobacteria bacterium RIFOXYD12_FULL_60_8]
MTKTRDDEVAREEILRMVTDVVASYVCENPLPADQLPVLIQTVHATLNGLANGSAMSPVTSEAQNPAVPVRRSVTDDYIICLEDGKKLKMLKRHLRTAYGMSPEDYRAKWGLPADYPMVAPNYATQRSQFAKKIGLGHKGGRKKA